MKVSEKEIQRMKAETKKWADYIKETKCTRKECAKHFGTTDHKISNRFYIYGFNKDSKIKAISEMNQGTGNCKKKERKETVLEFAKNICKNKEKITRNKLIDMAIESHVDCQIVELVYILKKWGTKVIY